MDEQIRPIHRAEPAGRPATTPPRTTLALSKGAFPVRMTASRLILLLQIYRDGAEKRVCTRSGDLQMLLAAGLISAGPNMVYSITKYGTDYVNKLLEIEP